MKIILDAMGGDNAPDEILAGAAQAKKEYGVEIIAVGRMDAMLLSMKKQGIAEDTFQLVNASEIIEMCDEPASAVRRKKDSSIVVGLKMLKEGEGDAFVSAGSTGALHVGASLLVRTISGVKRPALATILPGTKRPYLLMDSGANVECRAAMLDAFAVMGSAYMKNVMGIPQPEVGLVNNGAEESKGTPLYKEAHQLLKVNPHINFIGNIEPRDLPAGGADVVVCDGFTGNVILKLSEGMAKSIVGMIKDVFKANAVTKLGYLLIKGHMSDFKKALDSEEYGGAPLLGAAKPVIKAHGSSKAKAIKNAIRQAKICVETDLCGVMAASLSELQKQAETNGED